MFFIRIVNRAFGQKTFNYFRQCSTSASTNDPPKKLSPLDGVKILDLTRIIAGPYCTMILSDLGAEVLKIERPHTGDEARHFGPPFLPNSTDAVYFMAVNRNKKSVCVDIKKGSDLIIELAQKCDVLIENYVPGKLAEYGLGYDQIRRQCPQLIYCSITGYGSTGPYREKPGYDVIASAYGGLMHITGPSDGDPVKVGVAITDLTTGLYAHGAILAALYQRQTTGQGQKIDVDLLSTQLSCLINIGSNYLISGMDAKRWGTAHASIVPYQTFRTSNGYICVGTGSDAQFRALCKILEIPHIAKDKRFDTNQQRVTNRIELIRILSEIFSKRSNADWLSAFELAPFPNGPVNSVADVFADPHVRATNIVQTVHHTRAGDIKLVGPAVTYSNIENTIKSAPPVLGEHTTAVLKEYLNYDDEKLYELRQKQIIN